MNTLKFFFALNLFLGFGPTLSAQCDGFDASTFTHTTSVWDWRDFNESNWTAHLKTDIAGQYVTRTLPNPWSPANGIPFLNTVHLGTGPDFDYEPADGWELVYKSFGGNAATLAVETPTFILYNRFNSILRVFLWIPGNKGQLNRAGVSVSFDPTILKESALLDPTISPFRALQGFEKEIIATAVNSYNMATDGEWLFGDFPVAYDPCTCHKGVDNTGNLTENISALNVKAQLMSVSILEGNSFQVPQAPTPSAATGMVANTGNPVNIKDGVTFFKSVLALHGKLTATQDKVADPAKAANNVTLGTDTTLLPSGSGSNSQNSTENRWPDFGKNAVQLAAAYLSLDFLFTGGKETPKPSSSQVSGVSGTKYSGNISWSGSSMLGGYLYTPGSNYESLSPPPLQKPIYDYVLGVFNLLETPVLEFSTFDVSSSVNKNLYGCSTGSSTLPAVFPRIYQYKLKTPLKYVVNPASQLEVVSIDAALIYEIGENEANMSVDTTLQMLRQIGTSLGGPPLKSPLAFYGPVSMTKLGNRYDNLSFVQRLNESGIQVDLWPKADITTSNNNSKGVNDAGKITYSTGGLAT